MPHKVRVGRSDSIAASGLLLNGLAAFLAFGLLTYATEAFSAVVPDPVNSVTAVDLRDMAKYSPDTFPDASTILSSMQQKPRMFFPTGLTLASSGASQVFGVELTEPPVQSDDGTVHARVVVLLKSQGNHFFRKMDLTVGGSPRTVESVDSEQDIPLASTHFAIRASLVQRRVYVEDAQDGIRMIYPLAVGGFDPGVTSMSHGQTELMTPTFQGAYLTRANAILARCYPANYKCLPFLRINRQDGVGTPFAFHILQEAEPGPLAMIRGFLSHGCMRLRKKDLLEMSAIVFHGGDQRVPVDISLTLPDTDDHPHPLEDSRYEAVVNCAPRGEAPRSCKDLSIPGDPLTKMAMVRGEPPVSELEALDGDMISPDQMTELLRENDPLLQLAPYLPN